MSILDRSKLLRLFTITFCDEASAEQLVSLLEDEYNTEHFKSMQVKRNFCEVTLLDRYTSLIDICDSINSYEVSALDSLISITLSKQCESEEQTKITMQDFKSIETNLKSRQSPTELPNKLLGSLE
jgi:hypothetical protein